MQCNANVLLAVLVFQIQLAQINSFFLYNISKHTKVVMDTFLYKITSKKIKHLGINLTKEGKDLYKESFTL